MSGGFIDTDGSLRDALGFTHFFGEGLQNSPRAMQYNVHSEMAVLGSLVLPKAVLLGYVDVSLAPGSDCADVFMQVGRMAVGASHIYGDAGPVYLGFGDEMFAAHTWELGRGSPLPEARVIRPTAPVTGACCVGSACALMTGEACALAGGEFHGAGTTCGTRNCLGACCVAGGACVALDPPSCATAGGVHLGRLASCIASPCPAYRFWPTVAGDANCDDVVNNFDIDPFIVGSLAPTSVAAPAAYLAVGADQACWERRTR